MKKIIPVLVLLAGVLAGCGNDDSTTTDGGSAADAEPARIELVAKDFGFDIADTVPGGLVEIDYVNEGAEPHFAGLIKLAPGKTVDDVKTFFSGQPAGPPPFQEVGGMPTADPGVRGNQTFDLEAGDYALFCAIPSPDGVPHVAKGMIEAFEVTEGESGELPRADVTITARDFAFETLPEFDAGEVTVRLDNEGTQLHEINLLQLEGDTTVDEYVSWLAAPAGPPPGRLLSGAAIKPGASSITRLDLEEGATYAFICAIPDPTDGVPHVAKGMKTVSFAT